MPLTVNHANGQVIQPEHINSIGRVVNNLSVFDVKEYGAVGNGSTNDATAIDAAFDAAAAVNGTVLFPAGGNYRTTAHMQVTNGVRKIVGYGATISAASNLGGGNRRGVIDFIDSTNCVVEGLSFVVNSSDNSCIAISGSSDITVRNCSFTGNFTGSAAVCITTLTSATNIANINVLDCIFRDCCETGRLVTGSTATTTTSSANLTSVTPTTGWANGMYVYGTGITPGTTISSGAGTATMVMSAAITGSGSAGVAIEGTAPSTRGVTITAGVELHSSSGRTITGVNVNNNLFQRVDRYGVKFTAVSGKVRGTRITSNVFLDMLGAPTPAGGGNGPYGAAIAGGADLEYEVEDTISSNNRWRSSRHGESVIYGYVQATKALQYTNDWLVHTGSSDDTTGFAPGRVQIPQLGLQIIGCYVEGFGSFWDPDSMYYAEVAENIVVDCTPNGGLSVPYGRVRHVDIHDNTVIRSWYNAAPGAIVTSIPEGTAGTYIDIKVHDNTIVDDAASPTIVNYVYSVGSTEDVSQVLIYNNKVYVPNGTVTLGVTKQAGGITPPSQIYPASIHDSASNKVINIQQFPTGVAVANIPNSALYRDSVSDILSYKNSSGVVKALEATGIRAPVRVALQTNVNTAAPGATLDGVTMVAADRVLLAGQTTASANGIYVWNGAAAAMTRATDADTAAKLTESLQVQVDEGTTNRDSIFVLVTNKPITLNTTALRFTRVHPSHAISSHPIGSASMPANSKLENMDRTQVALSNQAALTTQIVRVFPMGVIRAGDTLANINFVVATTASASITNSWAGIARASDRAVLAVSATSTATTAANTKKTFTFGTPFTADKDEIVVGFVMYQATTVPSLFGINQGNAVIYSEVPIVNGTSNTGATTPVAVAATLTAFTADTEEIYAWCE